MLKMIDLEQLKHTIKLSPHIPSNARIAQLRLLTYVIQNDICHTIPELVGKHDVVCEKMHADGIMEYNSVDEALVTLYNHDIVQKYHADTVAAYKIEKEADVFSSSSSLLQEAVESADTRTYNDLSQPSIFWLQIASIAIGVLNTALLLYRSKV